MSEAITTGRHARPDLALPAQDTAGPQIEIMWSRAVADGWRAQAELIRAGLADQTRAQPRTGR